MANEWDSNLEDEYEYEYEVEQDTVGVATSCQTEYNGEMTRVRRSYPT